VELYLSILRLIVDCSAIDDDDGDGGGGGGGGGGD
jgi:hypothetical protein